MPTLEQPFTQSDFDEMEKAIRLTNDLEVAIKRAQRTGLQTDKRLEEVREQRAQLQRTLNEYRPRS